MPSSITLTELRARAQQLAGRTLGDIAALQNWPLPKNLLSAKGWIGQLMESYLGADAGNLPIPDFPHLGVELKTIPVDRQGNPRESTYVCVVPLSAEPGQTWENSVVWQKLRAVLWVPILTEPKLLLAQRLIGTPILWQPNQADTDILRNDWEELMTLISLGRVEEITAKQGVYLQIRPKAANKRVLTQGMNIDGVHSATLPRGFYLRAGFTRKIMSKYPYITQ
jgi:DNA mismatch repair protein MutH